MARAISLVVLVSVISALLLVDSEECSANFLVGGYVPTCEKLRVVGSNIQPREVTESPTLLGYCSKGMIRVSRITTNGSREQVCLDLTPCGAYPQLCQEIRAGATRYSCFVQPTSQGGTAN